jgi:hypothetical protein
MRKSRKLLSTMALIASLSTPYTVLAHTVSAEQGVTFGEPASSVVTVSFGDKSAIFRPSPEQIEQLGTVQDASMIIINGRTSTNIPSGRDEYLAFTRAASARAWLIARGVSPLKIMINYASAADYMTENVTPEGRLLNQRVEIEVIYVPKI